MTQYVAVKAGSDTDYLLRCLIQLNTQHLGRMPKPLTAYTLDWQPAHNIAAGGIPIARLHPHDEQLSDWPDLDAYTDGIDPGQAPELPRQYAEHNFVPHGRLGAAIVAEIDELPELADHLVRHIQAVDINGTLYSLIQTPVDDGPRCWIQPEGQDGEGDPIAAVDYATLREPLRRLAWAHIHGHTAA